MDGALMCASASYWVSLVMRLELMVDIPKVYLPNASPAPSSAGTATIPGSMVTPRGDAGGIGPFQDIL